MQYYLKSIVITYKLLITINTTTLLYTKHIIHIYIYILYIIIHQRSFLELFTSLFHTLYR